MIDESNTCGCGRSKRGAQLPEWRDDTSYSYSKPEDEQPVRVLSLELDGMRLILHRLHRMPGWYCSMQDNNRDIIRDLTLTEAEVDIDEAKTLALHQGLAILQERTDRYEQMLQTFGRFAGNLET